VNTVKPRGNNSGDEELRSVRVLASVSHGKQTRLAVLQGQAWLLIYPDPVSADNQPTTPKRLHTSELFSVDRLASSTVALSEITTLEHELGNHTVERGSLVTEAILASGEFTEVFGSYGHLLVVEPEDDAASGLVVDQDVKLKRGKSVSSFLKSLAMICPYGDIFEKS
jgi:hypothetical protein